MLGREGSTIVSPSPLVYKYRCCDHEIVVTNMNETPYVLQSLVRIRIQDRKDFSSNSSSLRYTTIDLCLCISDIAWYLC